MDNTNTLLISYDDSNNQTTSPIFYTTEATGLTNITPNANDVYMNGQAWSWWVYPNSYSYNIAQIRNTGASFFINDITNCYK